MPSLPSLNITLASLSVTALRNLRMMVSWSSRMEMNAFGLVSDLDIFFVGSCRDMILAPSGGR